jgi:ABC-type multidrug transport system ATPase subunit
MNVISASIEAADLKKMFGELTAVDAIRFSVRKGEIFGFLGPNGAGKTTIMKVLTGYHYASGWRRRSSTTRPY